MDSLALSCLATRRTWLPVLEVLPEAMFLAAYLCLAVYLARAASWNAPTCCCSVCLRCAPLLERFLPLVVTFAAVIAGSVAASDAQHLDAWQHFRQGVQSALSALYGSGAILTAAAGFRVSQMQAARYASLVERDQPGFEQPGSSSGSKGGSGSGGGRGSRGSGGRGSLLIPKGDSGPGGNSQGLVGGWPSDAEGRPLTVGQGLDKLRHDMHRAANDTYWRYQEDALALADEALDAFDGAAAGPGPREADPGPVQRVQNRSRRAVSTGQRGPAAAAAAPAAAGRLAQEAWAAEPPGPPRRDRSQSLLLDDAGRARPTSPAGGTGGGGGAGGAAAAPIATPRRAEVAGPSTPPPTALAAPGHGATPSSSAKSSVGRASIMSGLSDYPAPRLVMDLWVAPGEGGGTAAGRSGGGGGAGGGWRPRGDTLSEGGEGVEGEEEEEDDVDSRSAAGSRTSNTRKREQLLEARCALCTVVAVLSSFMAARCVWAACIAAGLVPSVDGVPTLLTAEPSLYDFVLFSLTELLPAAVFLWLSRRRGPPPKPSEQSEQTRIPVRSLRGGGYGATATGTTPLSSVRAGGAATAARSGAASPGLRAWESPGLDVGQAAPGRTAPRGGTGTAASGSASGRGWPLGRRQAGRNDASDERGEGGEGYPDAESLDALDESMVKDSVARSGSRHQILDPARGAAAEAATPGPRPKGKGAAGAQATPTARRIMFSQTASPGP